MYKSVLLNLTRADVTPREHLYPPLARPQAVGKMHNFMDLHFSTIMQTIAEQVPIDILSGACLIGTAIGRPAGQIPFELELSKPGEISAFVLNRHPVSMSTISMSITIKKARVFFQKTN